MGASHFDWNTWNVIYICFLKNVFMNIQKCTQVTFVLMFEPLQFYTKIKLSSGKERDDMAGPFEEKKIVMFLHYFSIAVVIKLA